MEYDASIHRYLHEHREEILQTLKELIQIPSVRSHAEPCAPFGRSCAEILDYTHRLYCENGFESELDRNGGYLLSYYGSGRNTIGLFAHADVVDVSNDWVHTKPFEPVEKEGFCIGRGALDDKSAIVLSLYCAKMLKELKLPFSSKLVLFTGTNEETGMEDIDRYLQRHTPPSFSLVPDTAFPIYRGNKSGMSVWATFSYEMKNIEHFCGGTAMNITPGDASAIVNGEMVTASGISRHSALPEGSVNAIATLAKELSGRSDVCESDRRQMQLISQIAESCYGETFGIEHNDPDCGKLTCVNCMIKTERKRLTLGLNLRFGLSADTVFVKKKIADFFEKNGCTVRFEPEKRGYLTAEDNRYIKACLKAYREFTGDVHPQCLINAGGTYGRKLPCAAEVGTALKRGVPPNTPEGHGGVHQPDECINIEGLLDAIALTLYMILQCDKVGEKEI